MENGYRKIYGEFSTERLIAIAFVDCGKYEIRAVEAAMEELLSRGAPPDSEFVRTTVEELLKKRADQGMAFRRAMSCALSSFFNALNSWPVLRSIPWGKLKELFQGGDTTTDAMNAFQAGCTLVRLMCLFLLPIVVNIFSLSVSFVIVEEIGSPEIGPLLFLFCSSVALILIYSTCLFKPAFFVKTLFRLRPDDPPWDRIDLSTHFVRSAFLLLGIYLISMGAMDTLTWCFQQSPFSDPVDNISLNIKNMWFIFRSAGQCVLGLLIIVAVNRLIRVLASLNPAYAKWSPPVQIPSDDNVDEKPMPECGMDD